MNLEASNLRPASGRESSPIGSLAHLLVGGAAQREATSLALDITQSTGARLTAVIAVDPHAPVEPPTLVQNWRAFVHGVDREFIREAAEGALGNFLMQNRHHGLPVSLLAAEENGTALVKLAAGHDLVIAPAAVGEDGLPCSYEEEVACLVARASRAPVLRVRRRPLDVKRVLFLVGDTARCGGLARCFLKLGLWPDANLAILPVGHGPSVATAVAAQAELLASYGRRAQVLCALSLDFEAPDLAQLASHYQLAVVGQLSNRGSFFSLVRSEAFETVADQAPLVLLS